MSQLELRVHSRKHGGAEEVAPRCPNSEIGFGGGKGSVRKFPAVSLLLAQFLLEAVFQFGADLGDFHARAHEKFAAQEIVRALFIGELSNHAAILAILIPAESSVGDGFRADVLKATKDRILFGNLERLAQNLDFHQPLVRPEDLASLV
jgi:hypothetical protein